MTERHGEGRWCKRGMRGGPDILTPSPYPTPELHILPLIPGDVILMHTDGLDAMLADHAATGVACQDRDPQAIARRIIEGARERGGTDNATCVVLCVALDPNATAPSISKEALEAAGRWAGLGVDGGLVLR